MMILLPFEDKLHICVYIAVYCLEVSTFSFRLAKHVSQDLLSAIKTKVVA